ncbi:MAG: membrane dipeptidase [Verrucomicrobia bacterium]|nr:membrane dipeptidase [Verrucomicrobiota bacterium]
MNIKSVASILLAMSSVAISFDSFAQNKTQADRIAEVNAILREVPVIDGHNDLPWQYRKKGNDLGAFDITKDTSANKLVTDFPRLRAGGVGGQFWSVYIPPTMTGTIGVRAVLEQIDVVHRLCEKYPNELELALTADDVERIYRSGKIASLIGMEGGHAIDNSLAMLRMMHALGARYMTLTHMKSLDWADAATDTPKSNGLSEFGEQVIAEMNRLGMLVDISHVSDNTMRHVLRVTKAPVIFSHSSVRALCDHGRNVPDDVIKLLPQNGGVLMVNFMPGYLTERGRQYTVAKQAEEDRLEKLHGNDRTASQAALEKWKQSNPRPQAADLKDVANHIDHIRKIAGIDYVGIGADYEGFDGPPTGLEDVSTYPALFAELMNRGYSAEDIKKVAGSNILRVMRKAEGVSAELKRNSKN